jgi:hypothetical protein
MPDLADIIKEASYYGSGGGKQNPTIADLIGSIGQAAGGMGQGLAAARAPMLQEKQRRQEFIKSILDHALGHTSNPISGADINNIFQTGKLPDNFMITPPKKPPRTIFDPDTGTFTEVPDGEIPTIARPSKGTGAGKAPSAAEEKRNADLDSLKSALMNGTYVDSMGAETPITTKKDARNLATRLKFNPQNDKELLKLIEDYPDEQPSAPKSGLDLSVIGNKIKGAAKSALGSIKSLSSAAAAQPSAAQYKVGQVVDVPGKGKHKYMGNNKWQKMK